MNVYALCSPVAFTIVNVFINYGYSDVLITFNLTGSKQYMNKQQGKTYKLIIYGKDFSSLMLGPD